MTFQYRVMRHRHLLDPGFVLEMRQKYPHYGEYSEYVDFREVYYKDDAPKGAKGPEWIIMWSKDSSAPMAADETADGPALLELGSEISYYQKAMKLPILNEWELPGYEEEADE